MPTDLTSSIILNIIMLLALSVVYEFGYIIPARFKVIRKVVSGVLIGLIGVAIIYFSYEIPETNNVILDTRSMLIFAAALLFGATTSSIAAVIIAAWRIALGGDGISVAIISLVICMLIGVAFKKYFLNASPKLRWLKLYGLGLLVHGLLLVSFFVLPLAQALHVISIIAVPVLLIYPIITVLLSVILLHQRERNEKLLSAAESEEHYKNMFDNNHACMLLLDPDNGKIIAANAAAVGFYGWSQDVLRTMTMEQIDTVHDEHMCLIIDNANAMGISPIIFKHNTASGREIDVEVYNSPIMVNGKLFINLIIHDITKRMAAEKAMKDSEDRFRMLVENAPSAILLTSEGQIIYANPAAVKLYHAESEQQLLSLQVVDLFNTDERESINNRIEVYYRNRQVMPPTDETHLCVDGTPVPVSASAVPLALDGKIGALVFVRDRTDRMKLEAEKIAMEAQLRQQQKLEAIGTLAGGVAHEINNPINGIMNYAQLILDTAAPDSPAARYSVEIIHESDRVSNIIRSLLQFSRQEKQSHSNASIYDIINQTLMLINTIIKKDQILLEVDLDSNLPEFKCRTQQIQQVLMNMMTNARDALNEKFPGFHTDKIIHLSCHEFFFEERRWLRLTVEDHGMGIQPELREKVFNPFFSTKPKEKGTGLGLAISFGIVQDHHGKLTFDSEPGQYTRFYLDLPVDNHWELS